MKVLGFTRPASKLKTSVEEAEALGFKVFAAPSLDVIHGDASEFERFRSSIVPGVPVIFGSTTAADHCGQEFGDEFPRMMGPCEVIAIGPGTAARLTDLGVRVDVMPEDYSSYGLLEEIRKRYQPGRILVIRSDSGTEIINQGLDSTGFDLIDIASYKLKAAETGDEMKALMGAIADGTLEWMAFTSPMSAASFFDNMKESYGDDYLALMKKVRVAAIGRPTADRLASLGRAPDLIPEKTTFHDLLVTIRDAE